MDKWLYTFAKGIFSQVNVIARLKIELTDFDITIQHINHYATVTPLWFRSNGEYFWYNELSVLV